ncbi:MAG: hypothetical protein M1828_000101 [Chrysothrix sp. TS-e1954]|nr:MAG: hypothetical protein M1828_000101 [Chrysothrix sp. TS-e1954]
MSADSSNPSSLKQFLTSIATIPGDLSNITAPPFVLADKSTTEFPSSWAEHPHTLIAPASSPDPLDRARLVLRWLLASLKGMQYAGRSETEGVKKPLNAFLGELFVGEWKDATAGTTRLISEQVSHHPPVTACYISNDRTGITAQGYMRQKISLTKTFGVRIQQMGHALLHLPAPVDESYLITLPIVTVKDLLSGTPYPELSETAYIVGSSGYTSKIDFSGKKGLFSSSSASSKKNTLHAVIYKSEEGEKHPLIEAEGQWNETITFSRLDPNSKNKETIETYDTSAPSTQPTPIQLPTDTNLMDPWESRRAWKGVIDAVRRGDMAAVSGEKNKVEEAQRTKRKEEEAKGQKWQQLFFKRVERDEVAAELLRHAEGVEMDVAETDGIWRFVGEEQAGERVKVGEPFRGDTTPW